MAFGDDLVNSFREGYPLNALVFTALRKQKAFFAEKLLSIIFYVLKHLKRDLASNFLNHSQMFEGFMSVE